MFSGVACDQKVEQVGARCKRRVPQGFQGRAQHHSVAKCGDQRTCFSQVEGMKYPSWISGEGELIPDLPQVWKNEPQGSKKKILRFYASLHFPLDSLLKSEVLKDQSRAPVSAGLVVSNIFGPYDARLLRRSFVHLKQPVTLRVGATSGMSLHCWSHAFSWISLVNYCDQIGNGNFK